MPLSVLVAVGFLAGWCLSLIFELQDHGRAQRVKSRLVRVCAAAGVIAAALTLGEALRIEAAYQIEDALVGQRLTPVLLAALAGVVVYLFRKPIGQTLRHLRDITLHDPPSAEARWKSDAFKDSSFPWYVSVGLSVSIVAVSVLALNPQIFRHLTILKAGSLEADFASGPAAVQRGQISVLDPNRKSTAVNWASFRYPNVDKANYVSYLANGADLDIDRLTRGRRFFQRTLQPVFAAWKCLDEAKISVPLDIKTDLRRLSTRLAERILADFASKRVETVLAPFEQGFARAATSLDAQTSACKSHPTSAIEIWPIADTDTPAKSSDRDPWDPYVIQAVGDLLLLTFERPAREDFFAAVAADPANDRSCRSTKPCASPTAGELSLAYAIVDSQVQSARPWPFDDMLTKLSETLRGIDTVLAANQRGTLPQKADTDALFRRNRLIDLTLGLQLFYQRAIAGYPLKAYQREVWRDWLQEVRGVLALDAGVGSGWPPPFDHDVQSSWRGAEGMIKGDPAVLEDAAVGSALGLVLLPEPGDSPSTADCLAAKSLFQYAKRGVLNELIDHVHFDEDDKATYRGLLDQIGSRIDGECGL